MPDPIRRGRHRAPIRPAALWCLGFAAAAVAAVTVAATVAGWWPVLPYLPAALGAAILPPCFLLGDPPCPPERTRS